MKIAGDGIALSMSEHYQSSMSSGQMMQETAARLKEFQETSFSDVRVRGGFWFGRKQGNLLPFSNPVSTAFAMQALALWDDHRAGRWDFDLHRLI